MATIKRSGLRWRATWSPSEWRHSYLHGIPEEVIEEAERTLKAVLDAGYTAVRWSAADQRIETVKGRIRQWSPHRR